MTEHPESEVDEAWIHVTEEMAAELDAYADLCNRVVLAWMEMARGLAVHPAHDSLAARDAREFREAKPDAPANVEHGVGQQAGLYVDAIGQHLLAVEALLRAHRVALALWPLVRAQLELAGRIAWLLDPRVDEPAGEARVARLYLEMISSLQRERFTAGKHDRRAEKVAKRLRDEKVQEARSLFDVVEVNFTSTEIGGWRIDSETLRGLGSAANDFAELAFNGNTKALYDWLSDYAHPSLLAVAKQTIPIEVDGVTRRPWVINWEVLTAQVRLACLIFYKACQFVGGYYAIDQSALERWAEGVEHAWFRSDEAELGE